MSPHHFAKERKHSKANSWHYQEMKKVNAKKKAIRRSKIKSILKKLNILQ